MSRWNHTNAKWKDKACVVCGESFTPKSGAHKFCSEVCKGHWQYISGRVTTKSQYQQISGNWSRYLSRLLYAAGRKRDKLTREDLLSLLEKQNYKCALSGLELTCELEVGKKFPRNASVDRIVAGGPYSKDNIQLVCRSLNSWRSDTDLEDFFAMCKAVTEFQERKGGSNGYET